jgi:hypothetical protein
MVIIPEASIPATYRQFMEEVKTRLAAAREALKDAYAKRDQADAYLMAEFAVLQVRRVTELVALGVVVAHNEIEDFRTNKLVGQWNADALFGHLAKLSDTAFPEPFIIRSVDEAGNASIRIDAAGPLRKSELANIYNRCGELLHTGKLKSEAYPAARSPCCPLAGNAKVHGCVHGEGSGRPRPLPAESFGEGRSTRGRVISKLTSSGSSTSVHANSSSIWLTPACRFSDSHIIFAHSST